MKKLIIITTFFIIAFATFSFGQESKLNSKVENLKILAYQTNIDTIKAKHYVEIAAIDNNPDTVIKYSIKALAIFVKYDNFEMIAQCNNFIGWAYCYKNQYKNSIIYYQRCKKIALEHNLKTYEAKAYKGLGYNFRKLNNNTEMWENYYNALKVFTLQKDTINICNVNRLIGNIFFEMRMYKSAYEYFFKSFLTSKEANKIYEMAIDYKNIGAIMMTQFEKEKNLHIANYKLNKAKEYMKLAEKWFDTPNNNNQTINLNEKYLNYYNMAFCYIRLAEKNNNDAFVDSSSTYLTKYTKIYGNTCESSLLQAAQLTCRNQWQKAIPILEQAKIKAIADSSFKTEMDIHLNLSKCYKNIGQKAKAYDEFMAYNEMREKASNEDEMKRSAEFKSQLFVENEKQKIQNEKLKAKIIRESEQKRQRIITMFFLSSFVFVVVVALLILKSLLQKRKANLILNEKNIALKLKSEEIEAQNEEITYQRDTIAKQKDEVETAKNEIVKSITYAERIQRAAINSAEEIKAIFPESFVFFRPRDIVSGDFYRVAQIGKYKIFIEADCTGHGVPGSLISMMGISQLKEIMKDMEYNNEEIWPATILDRLKTFVITTLTTQSDDYPYAVSDGMDMTICIFDLENMKMRFAAANQNATVIQNGEIIKLKGDPMPIGNYMTDIEHFSNKEIDIQHGDMVFLYSDGVKDQFGGPEGGKFMIKNLNKILCQNATLSTQQQCDKLTKIVDDWMNGYDQVDDMTLVGIKVC